MTPASGKLMGGWKIVAVFALLGLCLLISPILFSAVFGLIVVRAFSLFLRTACDSPMTARYVSVFASLAVVLFVVFFPQFQLSPYLAIVAANLIVAYAFGNRLFNGSPSILYQFVDLAHCGPELSPKFALFLRRQCVVWALFGLASAGLGVLALLWEPSRPFANNTLAMLFATQALWFILSHKFAERRYARPETWQRSLQLMSNRDVWKNLEF